MTHYSRLGMPTTEFGDTTYQLGLDLARDGIRMSELVWDCDELLWDWVMDGRELARRLPALTQQKFGHTEFVRIKPGMMEFLWGLSDGNAALGHDPFMRIATNGYPYRLFLMAQQLPWLADLVGPPANAAKYTGWRSHPRILTRWDYAKVAELALHGAQLGLDVFAGSTNAELLRQHFRRRPFNSSFKLPELAALVGKDGFANTKILIDDHTSNVTRFHRSGRTAIHAIVLGTPQKGRVPNVTLDVQAHLDRVCTDIVQPVEQALRAALARPPQVVQAHTQPLPRGAQSLELTLEIPSDRIGAEWVEPLRRLKRQYSAAR
ncbi:MAG: hypothetical protein R3E66_07095 [bacterium]